MGFILIFQQGEIGRVIDDYVNNVAAADVTTSRQRLRFTAKRVVGGQCLQGCELSDLI